MSHNFRAALAAAGLFALGACTTTAKLPVSTETTLTSEAIASATTVTGAVVESAATSVTAIVPKAVTETAAQIAPETTAETIAAAAATPAANETLLYGAMTKFELMTFVEAVNGAALQSALEGEQPLTIFAPNNQAFEFANLSATADVSAILKGHIIDGALDLAALKALAAESGTAPKLMTKAGTELTVYISGDVVKIAGPNGVLARITHGDMIQSNGVMHQISSVLEAK